MQVKAIYEMAVRLGKKYDIRGDYLNRILEDKTREYDKMNPTEQEGYDLESLENPFSDTRILAGSEQEEVKSILCGIDMETPELLLADRLKGKGHRIDMVLAHHPEGKAYAALYDVMNVQADMMAEAGVPINIAEGILTTRMSEVQRGIMPMNHQRAVDAARLLGIPFMCVHSPADNLVNSYLHNLFAQQEHLTLQEVLDILHDIPEYRKARELKAGPRIIVGEKNRRAGKIFIKMTGGTSGPEGSYEKLANAGVGTFICMHMQEKHRKAAQEHNLNVIVAGHMASDSLGMNLFLDHLEEAGIDIIPCSGLIRVKRSVNSSFLD